MEGDLVMLMGPNGYYYVSREGKQGQRGKAGMSAYELWLAEGNEGTVKDFLASLVGPAGPGVEDLLINYYTKGQTDTALAQKAPKIHSHAMSQVTGLLAALNDKQDALPSGTAGQVLTKTETGIAFRDPSGGGETASYNPLYDRRVISPVEIDGIASALTSLIAEMPHMCPKTIVVTHDIEDDEPAYPANKTDSETGLQLGHVYQLMLWGGNGNYDGYGHPIHTETPEAYITDTRVVLPSDFGSAAGIYYLDAETSVWTRPADGTSPANYIGNSGWTGWAFSGWYAGPDIDVLTAYQADTDCIVDGPYYLVWNYNWAPNLDGSEVLADTLAALVERYGEEYTRKITPADRGIGREDGAIIGLVYWATVLDITPCVAGTCPLETRIAALENGEAGAPVFVTGVLEVDYSGTAPDGSKWSIDGGSTWNDFGASLTLLAGSYTVMFNAVDGYDAPASQSISVTANETTTITAGAYVVHEISGLGTSTDATGDLSALNGLTFTKTTQTTYYRGSRYPVFYDGSSLYLCLEPSTGTAAIKHSLSDGSALTFWPVSYTKGAALTAANLTGLWRYGAIGNPEAQVTFTEV